MRRFHELFFTLSPDKSAIEHNINRALILSDRSAYNYYSDYSEKGYYNRVISGNINQVCQVDSLTNSSRSDDNPNGFIIEGFNILENKDISTVKR